VRELVVQGQHDGGVHAERLQKLQALLQGCEQEGRRLGPEEAGRVRVESGDHGRPSLGLGAREGVGDQGLVADMEAVEVAERKNPAPQVRRDGLTDDPSLHALP
jgi:hypothetical protein